MNCSTRLAVLVSLPTLFIAVEAGAIPSTNDGLRILSDPLYLPLSQQVYGVSSYSVGRGGYDNFNASDALHYHVSTSSNSLSQTLAYGLTDQWTLRLSDSYASGASDSSNVIIGSSSSTHASGLTDPTLSTTYRLFDQAHGSPVMLDLGASYSPDLINAKIASPRQDGNEGAGRNTAGTSLTIGRVLPQITLAGVAGATYEGKRSFEYLSNGTHGQTDAFWTYYLGASSQYRFSDQWAVNVGYRWTSVNSTAGMNTDTGLTWSNKSYGYGDASLSANYHFALNVVGQLGYDRIDYSTTSTQYPSPAGDYQIHNQHSNQFSARLLYTF